MFEEKKPHIRVAVVSDPKAGSMGLGVTKDLTLYGDYTSLIDEHLVSRTVMEWLTANGMHRWSIGRITSAVPLSADQLDEVVKEESIDGKTSHQVTVTVTDSAL